MMDSPSAFRRRRRRRVADENRKRAPRACDRCKARKSKCIESLAGACQRCSLSNLTCRFDREKSPQDGVQGRSSPRVGDQVAPTHVGGSPEENIAIDSREFSCFSSIVSMLTKMSTQTRRRESYGLISFPVSGRLSRWIRKPPRKYKTWWPCKQFVSPLSKSTHPQTDEAKHITRPKIPQPAEISRLRAAIEAFPPRPVADFLLSVVIKHGTDTFFYFDQAQFLADIDHFYNEPNSNLRSDSSFVCLAMAAFALGSQWTVLERPEGPTLGPRPEDGDAGQVFSSQAKALIPDIIDRPCLRSIQAPFVLGVYLMPASAIGSSYVYMGLALRKALAFDLHQNTDDQTLNEREREVRRRLWWSIYSLEKCTTVKLNRPRSINVDIITVPLPAPLASLDSAQTFNNIQLQIAYARLIKILDRVAEPGDWLTDATKPTRSARAEADLREWKKSLPQEFKLENIHPKDSSYRAVFHLYLNYYYAWIAMGKVSLVTVARAKLRYHFGRAPEMPHIDETVDQLSKACSKAGRKLLQLFENLTRTRNISRFSFTDFQGCSIAVIVTLVSGILERDSAYEARVAFGLDCLRSMSAGNMTAKMGVRFVEALQSITNEAIEKLKQTSSFTERSAIAEESNLTSEYNQWAEWLARQDQRQTTDETPSSGDPLVTESVLPIQQTPTWPVTQTHVPGLASWDSTGRELLTPVSLVPQVVPHETNMSRQTPATDNDFLSVLYTDEQTFLMGLTGLDVLDFSGFSTQL